MAKNKKRPPPPPAADAVPDGEKKPAAKTVNADAQEHLAEHLAEFDKLQLQITQLEEQKEHDLRVAERKALELRVAQLEEERATGYRPRNSLFSDAVINRAYTSTTGPPPKYLRNDTYGTAAVSHSPGRPFPPTSVNVGFAPAGSMGIPSFRSSVTSALKPPSNAAPSTATQQQPFHYEDVAQDILNVQFQPEVFSGHHIVWVQAAFVEQPHCVSSFICLPEGRDNPEYLKGYVIAVKSAFFLGVECVNRCLGDKSRVPGELLSNFLPTYMALVHQWGIELVPPPHLYWLAKRADPNTQNPNNFTEHPPPLRSSNAGFNEFSRLTGDPSSF
jgi:hypothetical protein